MVKSSVNYMHKSKIKGNTISRWRNRGYCPRAYTALDDGAFDFTWNEDQITEFLEMWKNGISIFDMAKRFKRDPDELAVLAMDQMRHGNIRRREGGIFGDVG